MALGPPPLRFLVPPEPDEATATAVYQITCIIQRGKGDRIVKAMIKAGARGGTVFFARGTGTRENLGLLGLAYLLSFFRQGPRSAG